MIGKKNRRTPIWLTLAAVILSSCSLLDSSSKQTPLAMMAGAKPLKLFAAYKSPPRKPETKPLPAPAPDPANIDLSKPANVTVTLSAGAAGNITVAPVGTRSLKQALRFSSTVESSNPGTASVTSMVHGIITRVLVDVGDTVKAGQVVAYINCPELSDAQSSFVERKARVMEAAANVDLIKTRVSLAEADAARLKTLFGEGISAKKDVEAGQSRIASTKAELETAKAMLAASQIQFTAARSRLVSLGFDPQSMEESKLTTELALRSPISGQVSQRNAQAGQTVGASGSPAATVLFTIVDLSRVWVMLEVPQSEVSKIKLNAPVTFTTEVAPGQKFIGRVTRLGERFDPQSRTASVRTEIENPRAILKPGLLVLAEVATSAAPQDKLSIPNAAIQRIGGQDLVFKKTGPQSYRACRLKLGDSDGLNTEVKENTDGLTNHDWVATGG
ncbi:MAG TPA: efflux RND transporter periplasmic adaptor subunit, partial [Candidatus Obscuribacter sp.]|nr:efflux RND transporter periplasmic adaptor subunit [Candidatus Obscuribacter sp.]